MTQPKIVSIAYPENQLVQRFIGSRQIQGKELRFYLSGGWGTVVGFVTGLDDDGIQVCDTTTLKASILSTAHVVHIEETGKTFDDLPAGDAEDIKRFTKIFRRVAQKELSRDDDN